MRFVLNVFLALSLAAPVQALETTAGEVEIREMVSGLSEPWAVGFLPDGGVLITERGGRLRHVRDGSAQLVSGLPEIRDQGQGGLLDVMVPRDFAATREIFLSFAKPQARGGSGTALASARLSEDGGRLENLRLLFEAEPVSSGGRHFGSRIVEARDGTIFLTIGERGNRMSAQDRTNHNGSVIRLNRDGGVPGDNPYVGHDRFQPEIWSYGHRNPQGAALDLEGRLLVNEHGAAGGDEVNLVMRGANYGWPVIAYGRHYTGGQIGEGTAKPGMEQPLHYWDPSIAPSGMMVYSGKLWPEWQGDVFVGSLKFDLISRLESGSAGLREVERIESEETWRVRDVREAPDGSIWFLSVGQGALYRMTPK